jgi:16S rRNA pseudouridine516 synthase
MATLRLDKLLADAGVGTRSEVKQLIKHGKVSVNGIKITDSGAKTDTDSEILIDGKKISYSKYTYLMLNKPAGVISATSDKTDKTVIDLLKPPYSKLKLFPVGRLDKDTTGLLILTNDGEFAHNSLSPKKHVKKTYYVEASGHFSPDIAEHFKNGITIDGGYLCKSAELAALSLTDNAITAHLTITEGKFHQVKRMFEAEGGHVTLLKRITFGSIKLDETLAEGCYRELTDTEKEYISSLKQEEV